MSSTAPVSALHERPSEAAAGGTRTGIVRAGWIALLVAVGSLALFPLWVDAWRVWSTDPLRSIGAIFPVISLAMVLWRWRGIGYKTDGSFWGLGLILLSIFGSRVFDASTFAVLIAGHRVGLLHPGLVFCCYGVGCTLLFGGMPLLRRVIFPLCLLLLLNPVPSAFNTLVDFRLQLLSADTARGFAHLIGLQPTGVQLKMMFAPDFGMMIVPGCNGVRGSVTLGYLALIFGYTRRLSVKALAVLSLGAFLMGYVLNLTRLCVLVIYYRIGLSVPSIQQYGVGVDYAIGCTIFLCATLAIGVAVRLYQQHEGVLDATEPEPVDTGNASGSRHLLLRAACFALLVVAFIVPQARAIVAASKPGPSADDVLAALPKQVGQYRLARTWTERDTNGQISIVLGDYAMDGEPAGKRFTLGLWMESGNHFVGNSKLYQGIRPQWNGSFEATAEGGSPMSFIGDFYDDGVNRSYDAETACSALECKEHLLLDKKTGLIFSSPDLSELAVARTARRLPILLRREWTDTTTPETVLRAQFEGDAREFMSHLALGPLIEHAGNY